MQRIVRFHIAMALTLGLATVALGGCPQPRSTMPPARQPKGGVPTKHCPAAKHCPTAKHCPAVPPGWELTTIVVASTNIAPGTILSADLVTTAKIPLKFRTAAMVIPKELKTVLGQEVFLPLQKGDPVSWHYVRSKDSDADPLSMAVSKKGRAIAISVSERSAVSRLVRPADHVDIIHVYRGHKSKQLRSRLLLQNIIVLAIGKRRSAVRASRPSKFRTVTLLVLPAEAVILTLAQANGSLYLTLRNPIELGLARPAPSATQKTVTDARLRKLLQQRNRTIQKIKTIRGLPGLRR